MPSRRQTPRKNAYLKFFLKIITLIITYLSLFRLLISF
nr:MAG TPA: hypothetical protein [Caudoviricetes sp.]